MDAAQFLVVILTAVTGLVVWAYQHEREKRRAVQEALSQKKYDTYKIFVDTFFDLLQGSPTGKKKMGDQELLGKLRQFNKEVLIYGSDEVIKAFQRAMLLARASAGADGQDPGFFSRMSDAYGTVIVEIRKDMGHKGTKITPLDLMKQMINDYDQHVGPGGVLADLHHKYEPRLRKT